MFAQSPQIRAKLYQTRIDKMWGELMGPLISSYTRKIRLDEQVLIIAVDSASLKSELFRMRENIRTLVNEKLGEDFIKEVRIL